MDRIYNFGNFHVFERQQFEDYLNAFVENGYHIQIKKGSIYTEKNWMKVFYRVAMAPKKSKKDELQKLIEFFEECGYRYIGQYGWFCIFESLVDTPVYSDDFIEDELIEKAAKRDLKGNALWVIACIGMLLLPVRSNDMFLSNSYIFLILYAILTIVFSIVSDFYFYGSYFKGKKINYSYQICLVRGFFFKYLSLMILLGDEFLFGTQYLLLAVIMSLLFIVSGFVIYFLSRHKNWVLHYENLTMIYMIVLVVGILCGGSYETPRPVLPLPMEEYHFEDTERNVFVYYAVLKNEDKLVEYMDLSYETTEQYYLDRIIDNDHIVSTFNQNGYNIYESKDYTYIMKNNNIVKTNAIDNIDEFVQQLNW